MSTVELGALPNRRFFEADKLRPEDFQDTHGFLSAKGVAITRGIDELLDVPVALIVGPPWYGKTFVAAGLYQFLSAGPEDERNRFRIGPYVHRTFFHQYGGASSVEPPWWAEWQQKEAERAWWIVDAIDEDLHAGTRAIFGILDRVQQLQREWCRQLSLILFCRKNEVPDEFRNKLDEVYSRGVRMVTLELAPPDENEALRIAGSPEKLDVAKRLIARNDLHLVGGYPAVIQRLAGHYPDERITRKAVWRDIIQERLRGGRREREPTGTRPDLTDQFDAAKRAAAVCHFADLRELDSGSGESPSVVGINTLFSNQIPRYDRLQNAAHWLRHTDLLTPTATGLRFSERHVQEWLAAFALEDVPLSRLKPLLSKDDEPFPHLRGAMVILAEISEHKEVQEWIGEIHGGLTPPSDALPWELQDAVARLDHLEEIARCSPDGLSFWEKPGLEHLAVPGIGRVLADRLGDSQRSSREKMLLLDVAEAVRATDILPHVEQIIRDANHDDRLRSDASYTLVRLGCREHFVRLVPFVREANPSTREQRVVVANVIRGLLSHRVWGFREAYPYAPPADQGFGDASWFIEHELKERMTLSDARWLLADFDWERQSHSDLRRTPGLRVYGRHHGELSFALHAVELLLKQDRVDKNDWSLLHAVVLARDDGAMLHDSVDNIIEKARADAQARRMLFEAGLQSDASGERNWGWRWRGALTKDDADWLADLAERRGATSLWLWSDLLVMVYNPDVDTATRERIHTRVHGKNPKLLSDFDRRRDEAIKKQQQWQEKVAKLRKEQEQPQHQLNDLVQQILNERQLTLEQRLQNLSWICFLEDRFRPNNVIGRFDELAAEMQQQILAKCCEALQSAEPTHIPDGNSYPSSIVYEAEAFAIVIRRVADYELDTDQIRKWLPSTLVFSFPDKSDVLARCIEVDRAATEDVLAETIRREVRSNNNDSHNASNLPTDYWSDRFIQRALEIVQDETLPIPGRSSLLRVVAARAPKAVDAMARQWLDVPGGNPDDKKAKRLAAIAALLYSHPATGVTELSKAVTDLGDDVVKQMDALGCRPGAETTALGSWPAEALEGLTLLLNQIFPVDHDPPKQMGQAHWVGPVDELRRLRDRLPQMLFERRGSRAKAALDRLSSQLPAVQEWQAGTQANIDAVKFLKTKPVRAGAVSWTDVVRLLDDAQYRLIRSSADLQRVLIEQLNEFETTVKKHLQMLYCKHEGQRKHLHEEALQTYLHVRLSDRLPGCVPKTTVVFLDRETQEASRRRLDIKVQAPTIEGQPATVVIEIKWSDHGQVSTSLRDQLGSNYLVPNGLTHGIYLVGWCEPGRWKNDSGIDPPTDLGSLEAWQEAFRRQADVFSAQHPSISICPIVIDLRWQA